MANMLITCTVCKKKFKGQENLAGKKIKCPLCGKAFVVPAAEKKAEPAKPAAGAASPAPAAAGAGQGAYPGEEEDDKNPYGVTTLDITPRCPNCAQEMADEKAFICLYCGYNSLTREIGKTEKLISHTSGERFKYLLPGIISAVGAYLFIVALTAFSVVLPDKVYKTKLTFLDHESLRMWFTIIALSFIWGMGMFAYKRLIVYPTPPLKKKDG
jgi:DNA-directed RNA polymerase subunit RPC12/RpoP